MTALDSLQAEHRKNLAQKGIDVPEEPDRPEEPPVHCRRCHRDIPAAAYPKHYRECPGFASRCEEWNCRKASTTPI